MLRVSFNLDDADLEHFAALARQTQALARMQPAEAIIAAAHAVLDRARQAQLAGFMKERYARLAAMLDMITDQQWQPGEEDRQRVINALACFGTSGSTGSATQLLDHAIMIELVSRDLHHDLDAYRDFCRFRASQQKKRAVSAADRERWLQERRQSLQARMHQRRKRDLDAAGSSVRKLFSLFRL